MEAEARAGNRLIVSKYKESPDYTTSWFLARSNSKRWGQYSNDRELYGKGGTEELLLVLVPANNAEVRWVIGLF